MKLKYYYDNGKITEHTTFINKKSINKEKNGAKLVKIFKITNKYYTNGEQIEEYITTLSLN